MIDTLNDNTKNRSFETVAANFIVSNKWVLIALAATLVATLSSGLDKLYFDSSYRVFFSEKNPELLAFEALENTYTKDDNIIIVLSPNEGTIFEQKNLIAIEKLTEAAWQMPYSNRVDSMANFQFTRAMEDDLVVKDLVKNAAQLSKGEIKTIKEVALSEPALVNRLVAEDGKTAGIMVTVQIPAEQVTAATTEIGRFARKLVENFKEANPNYIVHLSGTIMMDDTFAEIGLKDSSTLVPLSFVLMLVILALLVGRVYGTIITLLVILLSIAAAMGTGGLLGYPLTSVTISAPTIILTVAVANCVHLLVTFFDLLNTGTPKEDAMKESLRVNLQPVFLASVTTAIGFLTMNFSEVPPFNHLGNLVSIGVLVSFVLSVTLLPAALILLPIKARAKSEHANRQLDALADFIILRKNIVMWCSLLVVLLSAVNIPRNELNDVFVHWFDDSIAFRQATDYMEENLTGIYLISYSLESGTSGGINNPSYLDEVEKFALWLESQPETVHVDRFTNIMKRLNKNMHGDDPSYYKLPQTRELAAQYLLLYEMSLPYGLDLNNQINVDKSSSRINLTTKTISTKETLALNKRALNWAKDNNISIQKTESAGTVLMFSNIGQRNIRAMLTGTTTAVFLIAAILMIALRSVRIGLMSLAANLVPAGIAFGLWGIFVGEVGLSLSVVTGMSFGIVIDDSVHFLSKYLRARRENHLNESDSVRYAFNTVGKALMVTTLILAAGFLVLATSSFYMNSGMGLMTAIIITIALISTFFLLPPLLLKIEERK